MTLPVRIRMLAALLVVGLVAFGCSNDSQPRDDTQPVETAAPFGEMSPGAAEPSPPFAEGTMRLTGSGGEVVVRVQIAESADQQQIGLMGRTSMPDDAGMVFAFPGEYQGGFWMKNTLIPLSIAFIRAGEIVDILDMVPCEAEPCEIYTPDSPYDTALEVNLGAFERWGIAEGDTAELVP